MPISPTDRGSEPGLWGNDPLEAGAGPELGPRGLASPTVTLLLPFTRPCPWQVLHLTSAACSSLFPGMRLSSCPATPLLLSLHHCHSGCHSRSLPLWLWTACPATSLMSWRYLQWTLPVLDPALPHPVESFPSRPPISMVPS